MIRSTNIPRMTQGEIKEFRTRMHNAMTGNLSASELHRMESRRKEIIDTYKEFISANGGKNPILGI